MMHCYSLQKSAEYHEQLKKYLPLGQHHNFAKPDSVMPVYYVKGKNSRLWDADGNEYLDLYAKFGAMFLGHGNKKLQDHLTFALENYPITDFSETDLKVCALFQRYVPCCEKIRFGLSGNEMVQNALRLARAYTKKRRFIKFEGHFHGSSDNILGGKTKNILAPIVCEDPDSVFYTEGRASGVLQDQVIQIPWNNIEILEKTLKSYGGDIAAVIMEPVNINGGSILPEEGYLQKVRSLCDQYGIVLIFDEVITGIHMGLGGAQACYDVTPDLCIMGKAISSGVVPVSVLMGKAEIMGLYEECRVSQGGTFNGYGIGMAAIKATFDILESDYTSIYHNMESCSDYLRKTLEDAAYRRGIPLVTQGPATCFSFHCSPHKVQSYGAVSDALFKRNEILRQCMLKYGILCCRTSRMYMNITICEADISFFEKRVQAALADAEKIISRLKLLDSFIDAPSYERT